MKRLEILKANQNGLNNPDGFDSYYTPILQIAYNLGQKGINLESQPDVIGERYGNIPEFGLSYNYSADKSENGLSLANLIDEKEVGSTIWFSDRKKVRVSGLLLPYKGSDGENLILTYDVENLD